ncbi:hypothetical protein HYH03_002358 [Edaphochlamys debaryana]|uniref:Uncharacterized protein n=1 Tax=Edaphochlamys debaryana TaxID=47281 RepID=A0A836C4E8_9CHLO|nr:hypothetical protein HYH03_002358 [Edaphochlamys debaryana]|eukprot:KAG2500081.1 hypothetical protein HYH03_002358 [Edaphochlamys debaryana]
MGSTRVMAVVTAALEAPFPDRPSEGPLRFNVEFSPMASPAFEPGRPGDDAVQVARLVERALRQSGAVDQEALCVVAGRKVWSLRVDCHVLDHGGNLVDACVAAALAALMAFRRPEVEVGGASGNEIIVHPPEVREPVPLTIHHLPVAVTFALFKGGEVLVADPTWKEAAAAEGSVTLVMNPAREVCCVHKADGIGLTTPQFAGCLGLAADRAQAVVAELKGALAAHEVARVQARVRRQGGGAGLPAEGRNVAILGAVDPLGAAGGAAPASTSAPAKAAAAVKAEPGAKGAAAAAVDIDDMDADIDDEEEEEEEEAAGAKAAADADMEDARPGGKGKDKGRPGNVKAEPGAADDAPGAGTGKRGGARLSGPLLAAPKAAKKGGGGTPGKGGAGGSGLKGSNAKGREVGGFDELEAIAAVIAGDSAGAKAGAPEPELAAAIKPGKGKGKKGK